MHDFPVEGDGLHRSMSRMQDGSARRLVNPAGFHAHVAILHDVRPPDAVFAAEAVHFG